MSGKTSGQEENENSFVVGWSANAAARLGAAIKRFGARDKVAARAGISRQSLFEILRFDEVTGQGSRPRYKNLHSICDAIGIDEEDIVGPRAGASVEMPDFSKPLAADVIINGNEYNVVRRFEVSVSAGLGVIPSSEENAPGVAFPRSWLLQRGISADLAGLVKVKGDSMAPTINDGATVLLQFDPLISNEGVYVFRREGEVFVKRLHPLEKKANGRPTTVAVISDNPEYPPEVLTGSDLGALKVIGRVRVALNEL